MPRSGHATAKRTHGGRKESGAPPAAARPSSRPRVSREVAAGRAGSSRGPVLFRSPFSGRGGPPPFSKPTPLKGLNTNHLDPLQASNLITTPTTRGRTAAPPKQKEKREAPPPLQPVSSLGASGSPGPGQNLDRAVGPDRRSYTHLISALASARSARGPFGEAAACGGEAPRSRPLCRPPTRARSQPKKKRPIVSYTTKK